MIIENFIIMSSRIPTKEEIAKTLKTVYRHTKAVDMRVRRAPERRLRRIVIGLIIFFGLTFFASWAGIFFFGRFGAGGGENILLEISGPMNPVAGEDAEYEVHYKNKEDSPLARAGLGLYLPKNFILAESSPVLDDKNKLKLGSLPAGGEGFVKIKGKFFAAEGEQMVLQAVLSYKPSNFNANFEKAADLEIKISGSIFDGSLEGPDKAVTGEKISYTLTYKNKGKDDLENVAIDAILPADFVVSTSTPAISRNNRWEIGKLAAKADGEVKIEGFFSSEAKGAADIILKLGIIDRGGAFLSLIEKKNTVDIIGGDLAASLMINGATNFATIRWGSALNYSLSYKNNGKEILRDITVKIEIVGLPKEGGKSILNWNGLRDMLSGKREGDAISWTKTQILALGALAPGEGGSIDFTLPIIEKPQNPSYRDYKIDSVAEIIVSRVGNVAVSRKTELPKISVLVDSDAAIKSQARYYSDANAVVGSGPLPPKAGEKTVYKVYWRIENSMHELEDIVVSGILPESVTFGAPSADAGEVALDSSLKKVEWRVNRLPTSVNSLSAEFSLTLLPQLSDAGNILNLLEGVTFSARDKSTGGTITISAGDETTALPDDPFITSPDSGRVQQ